MQRPPRTCKECGLTEREVAFYRYGRLCRPCKRKQVRAAEIKRRLADPEAFLEDQRERLRRSRAEREARPLVERQRAKWEAEGRPEYVGEPADLDREKRCHWRFFRLDACAQRVVGGRPGWWWCADHDPKRKRGNQQE